MDIKENISYNRIKNLIAWIGDEGSEFYKRDIDYFNSNLKEIINAIPIDPNFISLMLECIA